MYLCSLPKVHLADNSTSYNITFTPSLVTPATDANTTLSDCPASSDDGVQSYLSVAMLMAGIVTARFG